MRFDNRHVLSRPDETKGIYAARNYLFFQLQNLETQNQGVRIDVSQHEFGFTYGGELIYADNVMMVINGTDAEAGILVVSAHYDTVTFASPSSASGYQPGANDNGSGVAALLEIARIMAQKSHRATIIFVLFSGEELNRYGSQAFLEEYILANNIPIRAMLNLDIIGSPTGPNGVRYDNTMRVFSAPPNESSSRQLARLAEFTTRTFVDGMSLDIQSTLDRPGRWGDHQTFSDAGFPAIRLIEQADEPQKTHNTLDNLDEIDSDYLRRTTQVALSTLIVLADGPSPPTDIRIDTSTWRLEWLPSRNASLYVVAFRRPGAMAYGPEMTVDATGFTWARMQNYEAVAIAAVDSQGQTGPFSAECPIPTSSEIGIYSCD